MLTPAPYVSGSATSEAAARAIGPKAERDRERVFAYISSRRRTGATCDECERGLGMLHQTASARCRELKKAGLVVESGDTRLTRTDTPASVLIDARLVEPADKGQRRLF